MEITVLIKYIITVIGTLAATIAFMYRQSEKKQDENKKEYKVLAERIITALERNNATNADLRTALDRAHEDCQLCSQLRELLKNGIKGKNNPE